MCLAGTVPASERPACGPSTDIDRGQADEGAHRGGPQSRGQRLGRLAEAKTRRCC